jgi:hypothetical protein
VPQVIVPALAKIGVSAAYAVGIGTTVGSAAAFLGGSAAFVGAAVVGAGVALAGAALKGLMPDLTMPQADNDKTRQQTVRGTIEPQKMVYGEALVSGPIFFVGLGGTDNKDLYHAIALTGHEVESIGDVHFDLEVITNAQITGTNVTAGTYGPTTDEPSVTITQISRRTGASDQTYDTLLQPFVGVNWSTAHRTRGIATISTKFSLTDSSQELWDRKKPQNISALVKGKKDIYDPRLDTSAGANPSNTSYQQWTDNPALCVANYLTDTKFGLSIPTSKIDWDAVETAADACDVTVTVPDSGTQKRFTANGVLFATDTHRANINKLLSAMNGSLVYSNGIYTIRAGIYEAPTESLTEDDLAGPITVRTSVERGNRFNTIRPIFIDPAQNHKSVEAPAVSITAAVNRDNNEVLTKDVELPFTNSSYMAQRIAHKQVQLSDQQKVLVFPANLTGLRIDVGDRVSVTIEELNYSNKVFRCANWSFSDTQDGVVNLTLLEDDSGSYADPTAGEYSTIQPSGVITEAFQGVPDPQNLSATAGLKNIELNWTNPSNPKSFETIAVYASADSSWANSQLIGETRGTQFIHDASNAVDPLAVGNQRYYWIRALAYGSDSDDAFVRSDRNPDNDTSNIVATVGPNDPDYSDIVDDTPSQNPPTSLTLTETTVLGNDGSVLPAVQISWTAASPNTYVSFYEVQFKQTSSGEIDYGSVANSYTATIDYGSVADATTLELNYGGVNEAITGASAEFSSVNVYGTSTVIAGMKELEEFTFKVRAVTLTGKTSGFVTGTLTLQGDQTAPAIPSSITATGGIQQIKLDFELPSDSDLAYVEIFENTVDNLASSTLIVRTKSDQHTVTGLGNNVTRYYWLRSADRSGNLSGYSSSFSATTQKIVLDDFAQDVLDEFAAGDAFGIEPVSTLSGVTGSHVGQVKLLTTTNTLFVWTGSAWSEDIFTASSVDPGSITAASFASGVEPISAVSSLPSPTGYTGPSVVFLTSDKKLYRYDSSVPEFTTLINTTDLSGTLSEDLFSDTVRPVERVGTLPTTNLTTGRVVMLTTDNKLYRYSGTSWTSAISAADLDDQVNLQTQVFGQVQASSLTAGQVRTAALDANAVTAAKLDVSEVFADTAVIGAIQTSAITAAAVDAAVANFEFVESVNIAADAVTAGKIDVSSLSAISANLGTVNAGNINASQVSVYNLDGGNISSGTVPTARLDVAGIITAGSIIVSNDDITNLNNNAGFVDSSGAASAAPVQSVAGSTGNVSASTIITAGNIVVQGDNISDLTNDSAFINGGQVNSNVTAISGGVITTGTINAERINIDDVTLDTDGSGQLIIKASGVDSPQIKSNALGTIKSVVDDVEVATQFVPAASLFTASTPFHKYSTYTLDLLAELTFTSPLTTSETVDYVIRFESDVAGSVWSDSVGMITTHIQRTNSLGDSYDINGTRTGDDNQYYFELGTANSLFGNFRIPRAVTLRGGSTIYLKLYGYQQNVYQSTTTPRTGVGEWSLSVISVEGLAR